MSSKIGGREVTLLMAALVAFGCATGALCTGLAWLVNG